MQANYSPQLLWECVKKDSSLLRKPITPNLPWMSAGEANLAGVNSFKFSGLIGGKTMSLRSKKTCSKESIVLMTAGKKSVRPGTWVVKTTISKNTKKGLETIEKALAGKFYRKDLLELAKAKYAKIRTSFKKKAVKVSSRRAPKN
eukprot:TRINITY_DN3393_c0_g3_i1.p2 TRINITY_DN3393_c0_g3~~TRINITY_DN3393_c0_g3_i1.p2  ORF type:complete len:145 (+),score=48.99 TRINITY_DN3393_c0_g3_i1:70-504(+)